MLWHTSGSITQHYTVAQLMELHGALEKIKADSGRWNKSLATLQLEPEERMRELSPPKVPGEATPRRAAQKGKSPGTLLFRGYPFGAAGRNRTHDPLVRSQVLYPAELQPLSYLV